MAQVASGDSASSLLSLSVAAASASRIPTNVDSSTSNSFAPSSFNASSQLSGGISASKLHAASKHRRLSSTGVMKRRMSDAREAAVRPSPATIQSAAAALSSLATLSLSSSPPPSSVQLSTSFTAASEMMKSHSAEAVSSQDETSVKQETVDTHDTPVGKGELSVGGITIKNGTGKKRGTIFKCESCSKVYRHPSCLIKHRWEHSPHWREASKFLLSKHQQVQLLEAAAILSHISPSATGGGSLPEDRSLWPFYLSGGAMAPPSTATVSADETLARQTASSLEARPAFPTSSSVPNHSTLSPHMARSTSTGPRMHDYSIPTSSGLTHVRPGVLAVPTGSSENDHSTASRAAPVPVPVNTTTYRDPAGSYSLVSGTSESWGSPASFSYAHSYGTGGWSLPDSSVRSESGSASRSRSGSIPRSEYEDEFIDVDGEDVDGQGYGFASRGRTSATRDGWKDGKEPDAPVQDKTNEEWDGMEMEMEM
ncbi:hypothetical protein QCA50_004856 [Cerrena zonata]|uniref:C2H2-type domain-containing protein n=1 Tax=Cerrena zonata TaxID=2478898 RepID=A0AAW0GI27_9APHY